MLNMRSKITIRWTTDPSEIGYGTPTGEWRKHDGAVYSMRGALGFEHDLRQRIGQGVYCSISYQNKGKEIKRAEIEQVIASDEARRLGY